MPRKKKPAPSAGAARQAAFWNRHDRWVVALPLGQLEQLREALEVEGKNPTEWAREVVARKLRRST